MGALFAIVGIGVCVGGFFLYKAIMNRSKECPECKAKYDSSCILDAKVVRTVKAAMGADYSDVKVALRCKNCGKEHVATVTVKGSVEDRYLDEELKQHFDK